MDERLDERLVSLTMALEIAGDLVRVENGVMRHENHPFNDAWWSMVREADQAARDDWGKRWDQRNVSSGNHSFRKRLRAYGASVRIDDIQTNLGLEHAEAVLRKVVGVSRGEDHPFNTAWQNIKEASASTQQKEVTA